MKLELINLIYETWQVLESTGINESTENLIAECKEDLRLRGYAISETDITKALVYKEKRKDKNFIRREARLKNRIWAKKQIIMALEKPISAQQNIISETRRELAELQQQLKEMRETL